MQNERVERFMEQLEKLIEIERQRPVDDRASYAEIIGAMEFKKHELLTEGDLE